MTAEVIHGDCIDIMREMPDKCFDCILTDPPYGVGLGTKKRRRIDDAGSYDDFHDTPENVERIVALAMPEMLRVATRVVLTPGWNNMWRWPKPAHVGSFFYPAGAGINTWGFSCWQPIFYYGSDPYRGKLGKRPDSFRSTERAEKNGHPCPKPIGQWTWLLNRVTLPCHSVLDPFAGSGTTGVACVNTGRSFVGIEQSATYAAIASARINAALPVAA